MTQTDPNSDKLASVFRFFTPFRTYALTVILALAYGYFCVVFFSDGFLGNLDLETFSWTFVFLVPYAIGIVSVSSNYFTKRWRKDESLPLKEISIWEAIFIPWLGVALVTLGALAITLGFLLCFVISVPIVFPAASFGGLSVWLIQKNQKFVTILIACSIFAPFGFSPVEAQFEKERQTVHTLTSIHINANAETVWSEIGRVDVIEEEEHRFNWTHWVGIPRPVEATLTEPEVGGVRIGHFENGLKFEEEIIEWEENVLMRFRISEASDTLLPAPLDVMDGETFDVVAGMYQIEPLDDGTVILHFSSEHYLQTRFNRYGARWTDYLMRNLQDYILEIIKERAELVE